MTLRFHTACRDDAAARAVDELVGDPSLRRVCIISNDAEKVGYIVMTLDYSLADDGRGAWVDELAVRGTHRGRGIGSRALDFFRREAEQLGATVVHWELNHDNPAMELYRRSDLEDHHRYLMTKRIVENP